MAEEVIKKSPRSRATRTRTAATVSTEPEISQSPRKRLSFPLARFSTTQLLYTLLLIAVFLIGYLLASVQYLGKTGGVAQTAGTQVVAAGGPTPTLGKVNVDDGHFPVKGDSNAKVTIVEFADFRCPFCEKVFTDVEPQLMKDYVDTGKVKFAFRQFPFLGPASIVAANAAECANEQNKFWDFHDYLYKNQPEESDTSMYNTDKLTDIAGQLGLNTDQFRSCLSSNKYTQKASDDMAAGQKAGVSGTPTFYVNGTQLVGAQPYSAFKTLIDQELSAADKKGGIPFF